MNSGHSSNVPGFNFNYPQFPIYQNYSNPQVSSPVPFTSSAWQTPQYSSPNPIQTQTPVANMQSMPSLSSTSNSSNSEPKTRKRAPAWTSLEEEILIRLYKEESENSQKKGKKGQTMWQAIAEKLDKEAHDVGASNGRSAQRVREKFFNMARRYKQCKDKIKISGEGSEDMELCPHFELLDEFMGTKDSVDPKFVVESSVESMSARPCTPSSNDGESDVTTEDSVDLDEENTKKRAGSKEKRQERKRKRSRTTADEEDDKWMTFLRESQAREERMMESFKKSEDNFKELFITAIKEFGKIVKKDQ